ncbi:uncharacterized protein [Dysidea avara]|uniref:uncharacterized protein isoform X2 n=1 Tax=Dysidea avara TaxID=196820 RepID=UPI00332A625B
MIGIAATTSLIVIALICKGDAKIELKISHTLHDGEAVNGNCTFTGTNKPMYIRISGMGPNCTVDGAMLVGPALRRANYINNFKITCSKSNISFDLECNTNNKNEMISKPVQVISKPTIISNPVNATVTRPGLPITLSCEVDGDPNQYWVGWFYKSSIIQNGDDDHSVSVSPSFRSLQGTTHHLTVHSVKHDGKYQCQVFTIRDGSAVDQLTHQVTISKGNSKTSSSSLLDAVFKFF